MAAIHSLLEYPDAHGDHVLNWDAADTFKSDRALFNATAREWTRKFAI
jgi:hypothetical protein